MNSARVTSKLLDVGFPIRRSTDQRLLTAPRGLSQFCHVLHRLLVPRHPPNALTSLTTENRFIPPIPRGTARTRRQTVKSQSSFACRRREGYPRRRRISQTQASWRSSSSRAVTMTSWVSCDVARPSECVASRRLQADRADATHSVSCFTLRSTMEFSNAETSRLGRSSGPGKT